MDTTTHTIPLAPATVDGVAATTATLGTIGEELAARHLVRDHGLAVIARNWRLAAGELRGELDLVAVDGTCGLVVVCEVKARRDAQRFGGALAAVSPRKRAKVRALAAAFVREAGMGFRAVRLDVVAIDVGRTATLTHVEDAL